MRSVLIGVGTAALVGSVALSAQQAAGEHPDLEGFWTNATATPLERPDAVADKAHFTPEEAARFERGGRERLLGVIPEDEQRTSGDLDPIYLETQDFKVVPDLRTSLIVDPANGKLPPMTPRAQAVADAPPKRDYDNPEVLTLEERCVISTGPAWSSAAPPMIANPFGGNYYQIVQASDHVVILSEGIHDARIIRLGEEHLPPTMRQWLGDSVGHWEGDTLVVDTTNYTAKSRFHGSGPQLHVVERFTRVDADTITYRATVEDPDTWTAPWTVEIPFEASDSPVLEYACHEANYSLEFSLRGERAAEARAAESK